MEKCINVLGRLAIIEDKKILVVKREDWTFLPGGHVEYDEGVRQTIKRECLEEFGQEVEVGNLVGVFEHSFVDKNGPYHEINFIFVGALKNIHFPDVPKSLENDIEIIWVDLDELEKCNLLPEKMREILVNNLDKASQWWSTME